jgi:hypothetical protein
MLRFGTRSFPTRADESGGMRTRVSWLTSLEPLLHLGGRSCFELLRKVRAFFGIVGVFVGIYVHSSSAMATVEEDANQEASQLGYSIPSLYQELMTNMSVGNITNGEAFIPETVWSLDVNSGVRLDRISGAGGSEINTVFGVSHERADFWFRTIIGFWEGNGTDRAPYLPATPLVFQVASCGGNSAERPDLDHCGGVYNQIDQFADDQKETRQINKDDTTIVSNNDTGNTLNNTNNTTIGSSSPSAPSPYTPNLETMPDTVHNLSWLIPAATWRAQTNVPNSDPTTQNNTNITTIGSSSPSAPSPYTPNLETTPDTVHDLSWLIPAAAWTAPFDNVTAPIDALTAPIHALTSPIDPLPPDVLPPSPIIFVGDPEPGSGRRPIPEAPTWVMTAIGFSVVVFLFRKKKRNRVIPISIIDIP